MKKKLQKMFLIMSALTLFFTSENSHAQMFWNNACSFAGNANSYISRGNSASLNITGSFSIQAWVNPAVAGMTGTILQKREGNNASGYGMYLFNGRVALRTNANTRLTSKTVLPVNKWTHVTGTYNSSTNTFFIAINAVSDTSSVVAGAAPVAATDSLFIGTGYDNSFNGQLEDVRIWNKVLGSGNISTFRHTPLGTSSGIYSGLVLSLTFQNRHSEGNTFSLDDQSGNSNHFINRGVTAVDLSNRPSGIANINDCIKLGGANDYLSSPDSSPLSPTGVVSLEAWIYPKSAGTSNTIIHKGSDNGATTDYSLILNQGNLRGIINNQVKITSSQIIPLNQWTHVAYVYNGLSGKNILFINGKLTDTSTSLTAFINNGTDSLYIGGTIAQNDFDGFIDEVRIKLAIKSHLEINRFLFRSIDESNDLAGIESVFNFDGYAVSNVGTEVRFYFRNNASFGHSVISSGTPVSPLTRADAQNFQDGFYIKTSDRRIPASGTSGFMIADTLDIIYNENIGDINVFIALNHSSESNLNISLESPSGQSVELYQSQWLTSGANNIISIFDDQADSSLTSGKYVSFAPRIKPGNNLNTAFSGINTNGKWKLIINDINENDTGRLYGWGIQVNNRIVKSPSMTALTFVEGLYNPNTDISLRDTMVLYLRNSNSPYNKVDSAKGYFHWSGLTNYIFNTAQPGNSYYIHLKHRNSIETWSSSPVMIDPLTATCFYNFTTSQSQAFGDNMKQVDESPLRFGIFSGDVNRDGTVDALDVSAIDNDAFNFVSGYVQSDITGNNVTDISDIAIAANNAYNFVSKITPP